MQKSIKHAIEFLQLRAGPASIARRTIRQKSLILAYHNVIPDRAGGAGDRSLHLPRSEFARQLDVLTEHCSVVPLTSLSAETSADGEAPRVVITFDDAYHGAVTIGVEELAKRALPATILVPPAFVGGHAFWWDTLADRGAPRPLGDLRRYALEELQGADRLVKDWADRSGFPARPVPRHALTATEYELRSAVSHPGIELASHSWSHPNLTKLDEDDLLSELRRPLEWLRERFDAVVPWLSYPYGISSPDVERAAAISGYEGALGLGGGWLRSKSVNRFQFPRLNVPAGLSLNGFALRLAGLPLR